MKIKITKCSDSDKCQCWYHNLIGMTFDVLDLTVTSVDMKTTYFRLLEDSDKFIQKHDCEVIEETLENSETSDKEFLRLIDQRIKETVKATILSQPPITPEQYTKIYKDVTVKYLKEKKPRIPDENTPADTLVRIKVLLDSTWEPAYLHSVLIGDDGDPKYFQCYTEGRNSKTSNGVFVMPTTCEIVAETIEEKRKRIFHKHVPDKYKWWAVNKIGESNYFYAKPKLDNNGEWQKQGFGWVSDGRYDPTDFENSLLGRDE
jgi:hypothetical protein